MIGLIVCLAIGYLVFDYFRWNVERPIIFKYNSDIGRWMAKYEDDETWVYDRFKERAIFRCRQRKENQWTSPCGYA